MKSILQKFIEKKSAGYNTILWEKTKLTEKGEKVVNTWLALAKCQNNEAVLTLPDGRIFSVTEYSVISGNVHDLVNFSDEVTMVKEAQPAHKWAIKTTEVIEVDETKLVSPAILMDYINEWTEADSKLTVTTKMINKQRMTISEFKFLYKDETTMYVVGNPSSGGIDANVVYHRKLVFAKDGFADAFYTTYNTNVDKEERENWIVKGSTVGA